VGSAIISFSYAGIVIYSAYRVAVQFAMFVLASSMIDRERLTALLTRARHCTPALFWRVLDRACPRSAKLGAGAEAIAIRRLVEAGAWTDAALALVKLELPFWTVRRLQLDNGEWHCALSQHRDLPHWLDNARETHHTDLALAILSALVEARAAAAPAPMPRANDEGARASIALCCDNFS
jgi:hypothetical protein